MPELLPAGFVRGEGDTRECAYITWRGMLIPYDMLISLDDDTPTPAGAHVWADPPPVVNDWMEDPLDGAGVVAPEPDDPVDIHLVDDWALTWVRMPAGYPGGVAPVL